MKVLIVLGTRPEVIKLAPVINEAKRRAKDIQVAVCAAGQHKEMLQQALETFAIIPDFSFEVMDISQTLSQLTAKLMHGLSAILSAYQPDWVLVQGDTSSAFVAGLAGFYQAVKVGHVEAGLRTYDLQSPFPEELNRQMLGRIATLHFAPTKAAAENLIREGTAASKLLVTGNTIVDAVADISARWSNTLPSLPPKLAQLLGDFESKIVFITCHRRENFGEPLLGICHALRILCEKYAEYTWIFPVHPNPNVRETVFRELKNIANLHLIEPLEYEATLYLMSRARLVLTDSGGIQEEAPSFAVPTIVMRNHTERTEGVEAGFAVLAGTQSMQIIQAVSSYLEPSIIQNTLASRANPYGDGLASQRIISALLEEPVEVFHG